MFERLKKGRGEKIKKGGGPVCFMYVCACV